MWLLSYRPTVIRRAESGRRHLLTPQALDHHRSPLSEELVAILEEMTMLDSTLHGPAAVLVYDDLESAQVEPHVSAQVVAVATRASQHVESVRIGHFASRSEAAAASSELARAEGIRAFVVRASGSPYGSAV